MRLYKENKNEQQRERESYQPWRRLWRLMVYSLVTTSSFLPAPVFSTIFTCDLYIKQIHETIHHYHKLFVIRDKQKGEMVKEAEVDGTYDLEYTDGGTQKGEQTNEVRVKTQNRLKYKTLMLMGLIGFHSIKHFFFFVKTKNHY